MTEKQPNWYEAAYFTFLSGVFVVLGNIVLGDIGQFVALCLLIPVGIQFWRGMQQLRGARVFLLVWFVILVSNYMKLGEGINTGWDWFNLAWHPILLIWVAIARDILTNGEDAREELDRLRRETERLNAEIRFQDAIKKQLDELEKLRKAHRGAMSAREQREFVDLLDRIIKGQFHSGRYYTPPQPRVETWRVVLGLGQGVVTADDVSRAYRAKAMELHKSGQGEGAKMVALNLARDEARMRVGN